MSALPPATLEGWYALHQACSIDRAALAALSSDARAQIVSGAGALMEELAAPADGWSMGFRLVAGGADVLLVHFRPTLDELADVQLRLRTSPLWPLLRLEYDYLSVAEAGFYHATAEAARETQPGGDEFRERIRAAAEAEGASAHVKTRLYPTVPEGMRYVSFYPMSKRRAVGQNWYALPIEERSRLMRDHGLTGRRFAGRVFQVITGSVGLDDWEWGVTLFARDPLEFKRIVTEMRYDEASAVYGEFGTFYTGIRLASAGWAELLGAPAAG
jgi:peroxiredoxin